ncbi:uncharacterized protein [Primulina huaijiensis]|uniref:uncharacterized protein n=1 Tax=Primulina huaijiensis TaxID=1492673 RepID=UPI003CC6E3A2
MNGREARAKQEREGGASVPRRGEGEGEGEDEGGSCEERLGESRERSCDRCTKFFHDLIKRNNKRNAIVVIRKADGRTTMHQGEIAQEFISFYKLLLGSKINITPLADESILSGPLVPSDCWQELASLPTQAEVVEAVFDIDNDKAPGPDGLRTVIGKVVDGAQTCFIEGRSIVDNIHLAQEPLRKYSRKRGSPRCMLKIDLQKAYDTVDWCFLKGVLTHLNFPCSFINWIMECVSTTSFSIVINGHFHGHFEGKRGLRQGDPLSPYLFALCIEVLSRELKMMARNQIFGYHPKCKNLGITHLAYADDLLLLSRGDARSVSLMMHCMNRFGDMAGLRINILKSNVYMASVPDVVRLEILDVTGFALGNLPFRYLGVPLASKKLRALDYIPLVDTISTKISSWPRHSLSYAGKLELIRSVVQGIECFWLSILPLPSCIIDAIYSLCRKFVWPTKHPPIAWHTLCKPIEAGGLGLKNLKAWNKALLAKTLWNIHNKKDSLWIKWINHEYSHVPNVWSWVWKKDQSPLIKNIIIIRDNLISAHGSAQASIQMLDSWFGVSKGLNRAYDFFVAQQHRWPWKPLISKRCILPKHKFILWLLAHRKLLTRNRLEYLEDKSIRSWLHMRKIMGSPSSILAAFRGIYRGSSTINKMRCVALAATVYHTWNIRNRKVFENQLPNINAAVMKIKIHVFRTIDNAVEVIDYLH